MDPRRIPPAAPVGGCPARRLFLPLLVALVAGFAFDFAMLPRASAAAEYAMLAPAAAGASPPATASMGFAVDPVCAFSDRYPVEIRVLGGEQAREACAMIYDADGVSLPDGPLMPGVVRAYINDRERAALEARGYVVTPVPNTAKETYEQVLADWERRGVAGDAAVPAPARYTNWPSYTELGADLQAVAAAHPDICRLYSLGNSVQGRTQWIMKITDNPDTEENEPEFKFSSTIHGDEPTGMEMCRRLIHYLTDNYGVLPRVTNLVDNVEIWIAPLHNPDGYVNGTRYNAHGVDLNRNFPDPLTDPNDNPSGREIEDQNFMYFGYAHNFILSANYHGGSLVMNYPWDCQYPAAPDNSYLQTISLGYAWRNQPMWNNPDPTFYHGTVEGSHWYVIHGGMQDWCYNWRNEMDITIEMDNTKWPPYNQTDQLWSQNRESMLYYIERDFNGIKGVVTDANSGAPLSATVNVVEVNKPILSDPDVGDYHRLLMPGNYTVNFTKTGYYPQTFTNVHADTAATVLNVAMVPVNSAVEGAGGDGTARGTGSAAAGPSADLAAPKIAAPVPNPVIAGSGLVRFELTLAAPAVVGVSVFDIAGREVRRVFGAGGRTMAAGAAEIAWDARDDGGRTVRAGLYFLRVEAGGKVAGRAVVVGR